MISSLFAPAAPARCAAARSPAPVTSMAKASQPLRLIAQAETPTTRSWLERLVVGAQRLADALGERLGGQRRLVAVAAQLLDGHVARGVDLGARNDPGRAVLVPDPDVLHLQLEERVALLRHVLQVELVAEVRRVLRQHAVAEEAEDRRVFALQGELELGLELVQLVEVGHERVILAPPTKPGPARARGCPAREPAPRAAGARNAAPTTVDEGLSGPARRTAGRP